MAAQLGKYREDVQGRRDDRDERRVWWRVTKERRDEQVRALLKHLTLTDFSLVQTGSSQCRHVHGDAPCA